MTQVQSKRTCKIHKYKRQLTQSTTFKIKRQQHAAKKTHHITVLTNNHTPFGSTGITITSYKADIQVIQQSATSIISTQDPTRKNLTKHHQCIPTNKTPTQLTSHYPDETTHSSKSHLTLWTTSHTDTPQRYNTHNYYTQPRISLPPLIQISMHHQQQQLFTNPTTSETNQPPKVDMEIGHLTHQLKTPSTAIQAKITHLASPRKAPTQASLHKCSLNLRTYHLTNPLQRPRTDHTRQKLPSVTISQPTPTHNLQKYPPTNTADHNTHPQTHISKHAYLFNTPTLPQPTTNLSQQRHNTQHNFISFTQFSHLSSLTSPTLSTPSHTQCPPTPPPIDC